MAEIRALTEIDWKDALVLTAFPTTGSVASIAGHYLQRKLDLPLVGSLSLDERPPVAAVKRGQVTGPVRIFGGEVVCMLGPGSCPRVYVVMSDLPVSESHIAPIATAILTAAREAKMVLCLDGVVRDEDDNSPDVFTAGTDTEILAALELKGVEPLHDALLAGVTGEVLMQAHLQEEPVAPAGALVVEAARDLPDGRAAAALIQAIDQLVPSVPVDAKPLLKEALELEKQVEAARRHAGGQAPRSQTTGFGSFI